MGTWLTSGGSDKPLLLASGSQGLDGVF